MLRIAPYAFVAPLILAFASVASSQEISAKEAIAKKLDGEIGSLVETYKHLHSHPELSLQEEKTSALLAKELSKLGFDVTPKVGGHGIVGILRNGTGPTVLVRADMDALPVTEKTDLPYASKVRVRDKNGRDVGVMHACGHDIHMTSWLGAARVLTQLKDRWKGTLIFIGQPAEEIGAGARMMLEDGLFKRFPRPDMCFGLHCDPRSPYGYVGYSEGMLLANVDSIDITVKGKGGHGSAPHMTIDPIVLAARMVLDFQTLVSRENNPQEAAVVTVGSFHGGTQYNIIPSEVHLQLTVRTFKDDVRAHMLEGIDRMAKAAAASARAPEPVIKVEDKNFTPALINDAALAKKTAKAFGSVLGQDRVVLMPPILGGEDFGRFGRAGVPSFFWFIGTQHPATVAEAKKAGTQLPGLHSDFFAPVPEQSIRVGATTLSLAVLNAMGE